MNLLVRALYASLLLALWASGARAVQAPTYTMPGQAAPVPAVGVFCLDLTGAYTGCSASTTTSGAVSPPTAALGKINSVATSLPANTNTTLLPANANRIALDVQCASGGGNISETGATLASNSLGATGATKWIPTGSGTLYTAPIATLTAVTAYMPAQVCVATEYLR